MEGRLHEVVERSNQMNWLFFDFTNRKGANEEGAYKKNQSLCTVGTQEAHLMAMSSTRPSRI